MTHEVYIGRYEGAVVYVGEGRKGRHVHLNSGISNIYIANLLHFRGQRIDVEVIPVKDKKDAEVLELQLIQELNPAWNTKGTGGNEKKALLRKIFNTKPPSTPLTEQHYLVGILFLAKDYLNADNTLVIDTTVHYDAVKNKALSHLYHKHTKTSGLVVERITKSQLYLVKFTEEFFDETTLWNTIRPKIK